MFSAGKQNNDAGGIYTYAAAGARFGYTLLWTIIPVAICLTFAQEISARMGVATGKGLSELIREQYGLRITFFLMFALVLCNIAGAQWRVAAFCFDFHVNAGQQTGSYGPPHQLPAVQRGRLVPDRNRHCAHRIYVAGPVPKLT